MWFIKWYHFQRLGWSIATLNHPMLKISRHISYHCNRQMRLEISNLLYRLFIEHPIGLAYMWKTPPPERGVVRVTWPFNLGHMSYLWNWRNCALEFLLCDTVLARYRPMPKPCIRPSVTSRCSTKTAKLRTTETTQNDIPGNCTFLMSKILMKFEWDHPHWSAKVQVG